MATYHDHDAWIRGVSATMNAQDHDDGGTMRDIASNVTWAQIAAAQVIASIPPSTPIDMVYPVDAFNDLTPAIPFRFDAMPGGTAKVVYRLGMERTGSAGTALFRLVLRLAGPPRTEIASVVGSTTTTGQMTGMLTLTADTVAQCVRAANGSSDFPLATLRVQARRVGAGAVPRLAFLYARLYLGNS